MISYDGSYKKAAASNGVHVVNPRWLDCPNTNEASMLSRYTWALKGKSFHVFAKAAAMTGRQTEAEMSLWRQNTELLVQDNMGQV